MSFDKKAWSARRYQERKSELALLRAGPEWKVKRKEWVAAHRAQNRDRLNEYDRARYRANPERRKKSVTREQKAKWNKSYRLRHLEQKKEKDRKYYAANSERVKAVVSKYILARLKSDPDFKLLHNLRSRVRMALKNNSGSGRIKAARTMELIGCDIPTLRAHIEAQFKPEMTWENHGLRGWHIDHRKPCSRYDLTDPAQQRECFHFSNLQPLWWYENISKGNKTLCA